MNVCAGLPLDDGQRQRPMKGGYAGFRPQLLVIPAHRARLYYENKPMQMSISVKLNTVFLVALLGSGPIDFDEAA